MGIAMVALIILPILISGCLFYSAKANVKYYYQLNRLDGQLLYLRVASIGLFCFFVVLVVANAINFLFPAFKLATWVSNLLPMYQDEQSRIAASWMFLLSFFTVLFGKYSVYPLGFIEFYWLKWLIALSDDNDNDNDKDELSDEAIKVGSYLNKVQATLPPGSLKRFLFDALKAVIQNKAKLVAITLDSRKVYVGFVVGLSDPNEKRSLGEQVRLRLYLSGYREDDNLVIKFTNEYSEAPADDCYVLINRDSIQQASHFSLETFNKVNKNKDKTSS